MEHTKVGPWKLSAEHRNASTYGVGRRNEKDSGSTQQQVTYYHEEDDDDYSILNNWQKIGGKSGRGLESRAVVCSGRLRKHRRLGIGREGC